MGSPDKRTIIGTVTALASVTALLVAVFSGAIAGARIPRQVKSVPILTMAPGSFEISLGTAPSWLPLSHTPETLTLIGGAPSRRTHADNAYVAFVRSTRSCSASPARAHGLTIYALSRFYSAAHSAADHAGVFAPNGGAPRRTYVDSVPGVRIALSGTSVRACVWLANSVRAKGHSLAATIAVPLLNDTFAASVSNLVGASAGSGGFNMYAFDGGHAFRYSASTSQCGAVSDDSPQTVGAGTPGSESISINTSPCSTDASTFTFSASGRTARIAYPFSDALATPPISLGAGACELDPLTGVTLIQAEQYLESVGCHVGQVQVSPYEKSLPRGDVSWAAMNGGVAEVAPRSSAVGLVINGAA